MKEPKREMDSSAFVILADFVPNVIQEIRSAMRSRLPLLRLKPRGL